VAHKADEMVVTIKVTPDEVREVKISNFLGVSRRMIDRAFDSARRELEIARINAVHEARYGSKTDEKEE